MEVVDISIIQMLYIALLLVVPLLIFISLKVKKSINLLISTLRMSIQLILVGLYLQYLFLLNNPFLNIGWIIIMVIISTITTTSRAGLKVKKLFVSIFSATTISLAITLLFMVFLVIRPEPLYDARYLVPLAGMVLGNCLRANILTLDKFYSGIKENYSTYLSYLFNGATLPEATLPFFRDSVDKAITPTISTMATMGLVSLPGMMTGQILGGSFPLVAIKYQIMIMVAILSTTVISSFLNILLSRSGAFDKSGNLKSEIFK